MYFEFVCQMKKMLSQVETWLDKADVYANAKGFDPNILLGIRLFPDQFPCLKQVQIACDTAKFMASRLSGKEAPTHADNEQTVSEVRARLKSVVAYLNDFSAKDFESAATRSISQPRWEGKTMSGADYFVEHAVPNFFFHVSHVYAILRHSGVELGKKDYLGKLSYRLPS